MGHTSPDRGALGGGRLAAAAETLGRRNADICAWGLRASAALLAVMLAVVLLQIAMRAFTGQSFAWSEELAKTLMAWSALLAAPGAYRESAQLRVSIFIDALGDRARRVIAIAIACLIFWLSASFTAHGARLAIDAMAVRASSLPTQAGVLYAPLPVSMAVFMLISLETALREMAALSGAFTAARAAPEA